MFLTTPLWNGALPPLIMLVFLATQLVMRNCVAYFLSLPLQWITVLLWAIQEANDDASDSNVLYGTLGACMSTSFLVVSIELLAGFMAG